MVMNWNVFWPCFTIGLLSEVIRILDHPTPGQKMAMIMASLTSSVIPALFINSFAHVTLPGLVVTAEYDVIIFATFISPPLGRIVGKFVARNIDRIRVISARRSVVDVQHRLEAGRGTGTGIE